MAVSIYCLGKKAFIALQQLSPSLYAAIDCVIIDTDKNVEEDHAKNIEEWALSKKMNFCYRKDEGSISGSSKFCIALGWRWMITVSPSQRLIVLHDSILPKYRGFNPLVTALINGDTEIGATCFYAAETFDTGPVILQKTIAINYPIKIDAAIEKIGFAYGELLQTLLENIRKGEIGDGYKQDESKATYSLWRDEDDYLIEWDKSADYIKRFIDATGYPYKGACFYYKGEKIRVKEATIIPDLIIVNRTPGKVLMKMDEDPVVVCGTGLIVLKKMETEDGKEFKLDLIRVRL